MTDPRFEPSTPFTDRDIREIEESLSRKLPEDYLEFVKQYGGAFVGGQVEGAQTTSILGFSEAQEYKGPSSLLETYSDLRRAGALPFADCEFGNIYVLTATNEVFYISYTEGETSSFKVSDSFSDFISRIHLKEDEGE